MQRAKAQVVSVDLLISLIFLLVFLSLVVVVWPRQSSSEIPEAIGQHLVSNIEKLLVTNQSIAFLSNYRIAEQKLAAFASVRYESSPVQKSDMKSILFESTDFSLQESDICLFFLDNQQVQPIGGSQALGRTYDSAAHASKAACNVNDPCRYYSKSYAYSRPVLRNSRIVNLYIVVCQE